MIRAMSCRPSQPICVVLAWRAAVEVSMIRRNPEYQVTNV